MQYFVTGATGFHRSAPRQGPLLKGRGVVVLPAAARSPKAGARAAAVLGVGKSRAVPVSGRPDEQEAGVGSDDVKALKGQIDHIKHLAAVLRPSGPTRGRRQIHREHRRHARGGGVR